MAREIPGYRYDPDTQRYFKLERASSSPALGRRPVSHKDPRLLTDALWTWFQDGFRLERQKNWSCSLAKSILQLQLDNKPNHPSPKSNVQLVHSAYPIFVRQWDRSPGSPGRSTENRVGLYFHQNRLLRRIDITEDTVLTPIFSGNTLFEQSNFILRSAAFRHGLLISSFEDHMEDMWETCILRFNNFERRTEFGSEEGRLPRERLGGAFQAAEINPLVGSDGSIEFLLALQNKLVKGRWVIDGLHILEQSHQFKAPQQIITVKCSQDGRYVFVSCTGGILYMLAWDSLRPVSKTKIEGSTAKEIIGIVGNKLTVLTFHDSIFEIDFSIAPPRQLPHQIDLRPFKNPEYGAFKAWPGAEDTIWTAQLGSDHVCKWDWSRPTRPAQVYQYPDSKITDIAIGNDGSLLMICLPPPPSA